MHFTVQFFVIAIIVQLFASVRAQDNPCEGNIGQIIPDTERCYGYIICVLFNPYYFECPEGHIFSNNTNECLPGDTTTCQFFDLNALCAGRFFEAQPFPDEINNHLFIGCIRSVPEVMLCVNDRIFDRDINQCVDDIRMTSDLPSTTTEETGTEGPNPCFGVMNGKKFLNVDTIFML